MSNDNGPGGDPDKPDAWEPVDEGGGDGGEQDERARRLDEKEERLEQKERELNKRERELEQREQEILERREENVEIREELEEKEARLEEKEENLDDRATALEEKERELTRRAEEIETKEQALQEYVGDKLGELEGAITDTIDDTVESSMEKYGGREGPSRTRIIGGVLLALVGLLLVTGGVANAVAALAEYSPTLLSGGAVNNYIISSVMAIVGLAANLAAAAGKP